MKSIAILAAGLMSAPLAAFAGGPLPQAAEPYVAPPMVMTATRADGDWTGFYVGAQYGYGNLTSGGAGVDGNGGIGGLHAGYRYDFGKAIVGAELDYNFSSFDLGNNLPDTTLDSVARLKLMAGYDLGRALVYVTGGAAYAEATVLGNETQGNGYFGGLGMDYKLTEKVNVGAELLGHRFEEFDNSNIDLEAVTLQAKVAYRF